MFPRVKLRRIESQLKQSVDHKHDGVMAYRTMPFSQYVADYALFRKCWDPKLDLDKAMTELAAEWGIRPSERPQFVKAVRDLDAWWEEKNVAALKEADSLFRELAADAHCSEFLVDQRDLVVVLAVMGDFWSNHKVDVTRKDFYPPADLVQADLRSDAGSADFRGLHGPSTLGGASAGNDRPTPAMVASSHVGGPFNQHRCQDRSRYTSQKYPFSKARLAAPSNGGPEES